MSSVSASQISQYGSEINQIANRLLEQLEQIESDINTINESIEKLKSYDKMDASEIMVETDYNSMDFSLKNIVKYLGKAVKSYKYIWDISVDSSDIESVISVINSTKESVSSLRLSGDELEKFSAMLSNLISIIETEILGYSSEVTSLSDFFNTIKDNSVWQEYKDTANYSNNLKATDLLYNKYRTKDGNDDYVDYLLDEMGNHRMTSDNRNTKYAIWFNKNYGMISYNDAFCAAGVSYTLANATDTKILNPYINVSSGASDAKNKASQGIGEWHSASDTSYQPKRGDIFYKGGDHTGIVLDSDENYIYTIEANTSSDDGVSGYVNTRIRNLKDNAYITSGGYYSPPLQLSNANDTSIELTSDYINNKLGIQNGGNE